MRPFHRKLAVLAALAIAAPAIGGCSSDISLSNITKPSLRSDLLSFSGHKEEFTLPPPGPQDLVNADGQCAAAAVESGADASGGPGAQQGLVQGGVALQMTECDVVRRAGSPDRVEAGTNERGERSVVLTYMRGSKPGIYRFVGGRLSSIERSPEAPAPTRQQKAAQTKKRS